MQKKQLLLLVGLDLVRTSSGPTGAGLQHILFTVEALNNVGCFPLSLMETEGDPIHCDGLFCCEVGATL